MRKWLNDEFIDTAFSSDEQEMIVKVKVKAHLNTKWILSYQGLSTYDKIFLLSLTEAREYEDEERYSVLKCKGTEYANETHWSLRSVGIGGGEEYSSKTFNSYVDGNGAVNDFGTSIVDDIGVRPAMWIDLNS